MDYPEPYKEDYFNSLPHTEVDFSATSQLSPAFDFNSLPHTEVDYRLHLLLLHHLYFNSLPHTEVDIVAICKCFSGYISTHYLTQRQTTGSPSLTPKVIFQLTTSHRGRLSNYIIKFAFFIFQLTTSHRGRLFFSHTKKNEIFISTHYLTQRQTMSPSGFTRRKTYFNSLPHTEVDCDQRCSS